MGAFGFPFFKNNVMEDEVVRIWLNDMTLTEFKAYYIAAVLGAFLWFGVKTFKGIYGDPDTPNHWSWKYFWRGLAKFGISVIALAWAVIYFPDYGPFIMEGLFQFPQLDASEDHNHLIVEMDAGGAFLIGFFVDIGIRKITDKSLKKVMT